MKERPILFSGEMVRAILAGRKTQTRRVIKSTSRKYPDFVLQEGENGWWPYYSDDGESAFCGDMEIPFRCPYGRPGDLLWVRETWRIGAWNIDDRMVAIDYLADDTSRKEWLRPDFLRFTDDMDESIEDAEKAGIEANEFGRFKWKPGESPCRKRPSIHMPRWASRLTLRITDVRVERVQDISPYAIEAEGLYSGELNPILRAAELQNLWIYLWDSINAKRGYPWDLNPWVWVVEFEAIKVVEA